MTLVDALERAWKTLEAGGTTNAVQRSLSDLGVPNSAMSLAIENGCREILFPASNDFSLGNFPRTRGVKVVVRTHQQQGASQRYLVIRCERENFHGVFRRFSAAVLEQVSNSADPASAAANVIRSWQEMFDRAAEKREETLFGLFGELDELVTLAKRGPNAVQAWTGPMARPQDFIHGKFALEVKTTKSLTAEVEINGLEQLWTKPYETLVLVVKQVAIEPAGKRLRDIVEEAIASGVQAELLYDRLANYDLDAAALSALETPRFTHRSSRYFLVTEGSPVVTPESLNGPLPSGVSRLRYRTVLDHAGFTAMSQTAIHTFLTKLAGE